MSTTLTEPVEIPLPPTEDKLPYDDGEPMETGRHRMQMELLIQALEPWLGRRATGYVAGNMFVYFSPQQVRNYDFKGPDVFVALDVDPRERKSWVVWEEGKGPDVVIELLSASTAQYDKNDKKIIYQDRLRVPEYYWFDPFNPRDRAGFTLCNGVYKPIEADPRGTLHSACLNLDLVLWEGVFSGVETTWLRWATPQGELIPTDREIAQKEAEAQAQRAEAQAQRAEAQAQRAEAQAQRAETQAQRAAAAEHRAEKLAAKLRGLGVDPDE